jgi:hypothetical protein
LEVIIPLGTKQPKLVLIKGADTEFGYGARQTVPNPKLQVQDSLIKIIPTFEREEGVQLGHQERRAVPEKQQMVDETMQASFISTGMDSNRN